MKAPSFSTRIAGLALLVFWVLCSFAASRLLSYPKGLAVDAKGNLYVANSGGNDILVYNRNYSQVTSKTITSTLSNPSGVDLDPVDNLWVANYGTAMAAAWAA